MRLALVRYDASVTPGGRMAWFLCSCGREKRMRASRVLSGQIKSCGCYSAELVRRRSFKHGHASQSGNGRHTRTYYTWSSMRARCANPKNRRYSTYGARGIAVCERWLGPDGFLNFLADMGEKPIGASIDRVDNDRGYSPDNCRWALTREEQARNKTSTVLCDVSVALMRHMCARGGRHEDIAHAFGVTPRTTRDVVARRTWR